MNTFVGQRTRQRRSSIEKAGHVITSSWRVPAFDLVVTSCAEGSSGSGDDKAGILTRMSADIPLAQSDQRTRRTRIGVPPISNAVIGGTELDG